MGKIYWISYGGNSLARAEDRDGKLVVQYGHHSSGGWIPWTYVEEYDIYIIDESTRTIYIPDGDTWCVWNIVSAD